MRDGIGDYIYILNRIYFIWQLKIFKARSESALLQVILSLFYV